MRLTKNEHQQNLANHSPKGPIEAVRNIFQCHAVRVCSTGGVGVGWGWGWGGGGGGGLQYGWRAGREEEGEEEEEEEEEIDGNVKRSEQPVLFGWGRKWRL